MIGRPVIRPQAGRERARISSISRPAASISTRVSWTREIIEDPVSTIDGAIFSPLRTIGSIVSVLCG